MFGDIDFYKRKRELIESLVVDLGYPPTDPQHGQIVLDWFNKNFVEVGTRLQHDVREWSRHREKKDALEFHIHCKRRMYLNVGEEMFEQHFGSYTEFDGEFPKGSRVRELRVLVLK